MHQVGAFEGLGNLSRQGWGGPLSWGHSLSQGVMAEKAPEILILPLSPGVQGQPSLLPLSSPFPSFFRPSGMGCQAVMQPRPWEALGGSEVPDLEVGVNWEPVLTP